MAESIDKILKKLKSEVTCPLCLDIFTEPKRLPCDHVYCKACLQGLSLRSNTANISCPECRKDLAIPSNGVADYSTPSQVNRLVVMYHESLKPAKTEADTPQLATCEVHSSQLLAIYCETCEKLVCSSCVIHLCAKEDHNHGNIDEMILKHENDLSQKIEKVRQLRHKITTALELVSTSDRALQLTMKSELQQAEKKFDSLEETLALQRKCSTNSIKKHFLEQKVLNTSKKNELSEILMKLESILHSVDKSSSLKSAILTGITINKRNVEDFLKQFQNLSLQPLTLPKMESEIVSLEEFKLFCDTRNYQYTKGDTLKSHIERSHDLSTLTICEKVDVAVHFNLQKDLFGEIKITPELRCCHDKSTQVVSVKEIDFWTCSLCFTPQKRGKHELHIKHNDAHICGSPIQTFVTVQPSKLEKLASKQISNIAGIAIHEQKVYAVQGDKVIKILELSTLSEEGTIKVNGVTEIVVDSSHIYATEAAKHRLIKMDMNGLIIKCTGTLGKAPGQFHSPSGIRLSKNSELYVCDTNNHRIQVFSKTLNFIKVIARLGSANNCLNMPRSVDFDNIGNIYIVNHKNHVIQVLSPQGHFIQSIGRPGSKPGELHLPSYAAVHMGMIYITDYGNRRMSVYKTTGEFLSTFGKGTLNRPESVVIDDNGFVYICDSEFKIVKF